MTNRNRHWPDALSAAELLELLRRPPGRNVLRDEIAVVVDFQEKGVREVTRAVYDEDHRILIMELE